jgi:hypothetical protein
MTIEQYFEQHPERKPAPIKAHQMTAVEGVKGMACGIVYFGVLAILGIGFIELLVFIVKTAL